MDGEDHDGEAAAVIDFRPLRERFPTWSWRSGDRPVRVYVEANIWLVNRPYFIGGWIDDRNLNGALAWGNRSSDPVLLIDVSVTLPEWIGRPIDRFYARRRS